MSAVAEARNRLKMVADGAQVGSTTKAWTAFRSDLSLILALPDREALAEMIWNGLMDRGEEPQLAFAHDTADRILSHLKGESSND